jgi:hypothetical protein
MWGWLKAICRALFDALFDKLWKEAEKPDTITHAQTPPNIKSDFDKRITDWMSKHPNSDCGLPK